MAFLNNDQQDPEIMNFGTPATQGGGGGTISRGAGGGSMSFGGGQQKGPTASGSFSNLQGYLKANEGAAQSMFNTANSPTVEKYNQIESAINNPDWGNPFGSMNSGSFARTADAITGAADKASSDLASGKYFSGLAQQIGTKTGGGAALNSAIMGTAPGAAKNAVDNIHKWSGIKGMMQDADTAKGLGVSYKTYMDWRDKPAGPDNPLTNRNRPGSPSDLADPNDPYSYRI